MATPSAAERSRWMLASALFCAATVVFLVYRDLFVPFARDVEVWLGFEVRGRAAMLTAPLHWAIFGAGAWAFWRGHSWVVPWAGGYAVYVGGSHLVWNLVSPHGCGWLPGLAQAIAIAIPGLLLLRASRLARSGRPTKV